MLPNQSFKSLTALSAAWMFASVGTAVVARTVTDPKSISEGVEIDYSYNETEIGRAQNSVKQYEVPSGHTGYISAPGCPKSIEGFPWVHYNGKCHLAGFQGPCGAGMKMFIHPECKNNHTGICNCECYDKSWTTDLSYPGNKTYCFDDIKGRHFSLFAPKMTCFKLMSQGPCDDGEWFVVDPTQQKSMCEPRKCPEGNEFFPSFFDKETNSCSKLNDYCNGTYTVFQLSTDNWIPKCSAPIQSGIASGLDPNSCGALHFSSILNMCVKNLSRGSSVG